MTTCYRCAGTRKKRMRFLSREGHMADDDTAVCLRFKSLSEVYSFNETKLKESWIVPTSDIILYQEWMVQFVFHESKLCNTYQYNQECNKLTYFMWLVGWCELTPNIHSLPWELEKNMKTTTWLAAWHHPKPHHKVFVTVHTDSDICVFCEVWYIKWLRLKIVCGLLNWDNLCPQVL